MLYHLDLIHQLGPGGVYLDEAHTVAHMRQALLLPLVSDRDSYDEWYEQGQRSRVEVARDKVRAILLRHQPPPLSDAVQQAIQEVVAAYSY